MRKLHVMVAAGAGTLGLVLAFKLGEWRGGNRVFETQSYIGMTMAVELHHRDSQLDPATLRWMAVARHGAYTKGTPPPGVALQVLRVDPWLAEEPLYRLAVGSLSLNYNYLTIAQACHLALHGEDSERVRAILELASMERTGALAPHLLPALPAVIAGDEAARHLFEQELRLHTRSPPNREWYWEEALLSNLSAWTTPPTPRDPQEDGQSEH